MGLLGDKIMIRKLLMAALFLLLSFSVAPIQAYAAVDQTQDEALLIKKKLAELKAGDERKKAALAADAAKLKAAKLRIAKLKAEQLRATRTAARRDCGSFLQCLFGKPRHGKFSSGMSNRSLRKQVAWNETKYAPGTLIVKTPERALYYVLGDGEAMRYSIGVGREGFQWGGSSKIIAKQEWPSWREAPAIPWERAPCISAAPFTACTARTPRPPSGERSHRAASA
jgi:lipoprotein-anchoring transpeptidase ErfK/SrfK